MKVGMESNHFAAEQSKQAATSAKPSSVSFSSVLEEVAGKAGVSGEVDFTSMTLQEMFDWMNGKIKNGEMSLDESQPFLGMTMKMSAATGASVDMASDASRINFIQKAHLGIEAAHVNSDSQLASKLQSALEMMRKLQSK